MPATPVLAQTTAALRPSSVKAAFLYKFASFVDWPAQALGSPGQPLVFGVIDDDDVAADLEQITAGRSVQGRPLTVQRLRTVEPGQRLHILFAGGTRESRLRQWFANASGPVLTVTDLDTGHRLGGVLNFVTDDGRVRFTASVFAATERGLRLSARLLAVAQAVETR